MMTVEEIETAVDEMFDAELSRLRDDIRRVSLSECSLLFARIDAKRREVKEACLSHLRLNPLASPNELMRAAQRSLS